ncbi:diguanylate cyclase [Bacillus weihaiensis]|uniref:GGDEF domain-containing protein n=1 Tax=Bacillus weihaiensis TaxID=1547283 RepID=A0A1L3MWV0_9BACI|nr:diguanylate cyclase [Bacillus weihaiensis]APH06821.1 hypothetical protein A9C19_20275 [Bacillus weihaiensis]
MNWMDPYTFMLFSLGLSVIFLSFALLRSPRKLSRTLLACASGLSGMLIILTVIELLIDDPNTMIVLRNFQQISLVFIPIILLGYAKELYQESAKKTMRLVGLLFIPSIIDLTLVFTDSYHGLMRKEITIESIWTYTEVSTKSTLLNSSLGAYPFVLCLVTIFLLIRNMFDVPKQYRMTHWLTALVIALPIVVLITTSMLSIEIPGIFALSYSSMALFLILVNKRMDFNTIWPLSRQEVLENLSEGILLIDQKGKIVEVNKACCQMMKRLFDLEHEQVYTNILYQSAYTYFQDVKPLTKALSRQEPTTFQYERNGQYFDVSMTILREKTNDLRLVVWKDITDKKEIEQQLIEQARLDSLTKLTNREAFLELYNQKTGQDESCFLLMDIDHFKLFNDRFGHLVGDKVLKYVAGLMKIHFRGDILTRLGGEEFGVYRMSSVEGAITQAKAFQLALKEESHLIDSAITDFVTVSIGICPVEPGAPFEKVYEMADDAMYQVKEDGRDSIKVC